MKYLLKAVLIMILALTVAGCEYESEKQLRLQREQLQQLQQQNVMLQNQAQIPVQQYQQPQQNQPVIVQSAPVQQESHAVQDMMIGGLIGHAMSGSSSNNTNYSNPGYQRQNVTKNVTINKTIVTKPSNFSSRSSFRPATRR